MKRIIENLSVPFEIEKVVLLNEGYDNISVEVNDGWIFRFPKKPDVPTEREIRLLRMLKGKFHVKIPEVEQTFQDPVGMCYRKIAGEELTRDRLRTLSKSAYDALADDVAQFFADLHSAISVDEARAIGIEERSFADSVDPGAEHLVVLHADLSPDNMAFDVEKERLNGVFDFSDAAIGDLNLEFVHLLRFDPTLAKNVAESYTKKTGRTCDLGRTESYAKLIDANAK